MTTSNASRHPATPTPVGRSFRWIFNGPLSAALDAGALSGVLHRIAGHLEPLGPHAIIEQLAAHTNDDTVQVVVDFDRSQMRADPGWLMPGVAGEYSEGGMLGADEEFMVDLAAKLDARTVVDLGCGPGALACALATDPGRRVIGVDPSPVMVSFARTRPRAELVEWVEGDATALDMWGADLVVVTGNVLMEVLDDDWEPTLQAVHDALRPGGTFAFGVRNWAAREWEHWADRYGTHQVIEGDGLVYAIWRQPFGDNGGFIDSQDEYRYRTLDDMTRSLEATGFIVQHVYGDWTREPLTETSPNIVIVAARTTATASGPDTVREDRSTTDG